MLKKGPFVVEYFVIVGSLVICNLSYAIMEFNSYMCHMQLKMNCIQQLQNDNFLLV